MDASAFRITHLPSIAHQTHKSNPLFRFSRYNPFKVETKRNEVAFDEAAYEAQRLRLDAKARESMATEAAEIERNGGDDDPKAWKWVIRKRVWDLMEARNIAQFPRPVHHRIPNFVGASIAANKLSMLEVFLKAKCVKVNPDTPQKQVRFLTLNGIYWEKLSPEKLGQIKILRELKAKIERETGHKLPTGPSEKLPPTARRRQSR